MNDRDESPQYGKTKKADCEKPLPKGSLQVQIRWLTSRDMHAVLSVENASFEQCWSEGDFNSALRQRNCFGVVAENDHKIVGFMIYAYRNDTLRVVNFAIDPQTRRQGVGRQMLGWLVNKMSPLFRNQINLIVNEGNLGAQKFFQACGFRGTGVERGPFDDTDADGYHMALTHPCSDMDLPWLQKLNRERAEDEQHGKS
jgi:ribosomal-protein-alanine N-acetyltransferase